MPLTTYAELQTFLATELDTDPGGSIIVDAITLGEARINGDLGSIRTAWTSTTLTGTPSSRSVALPAAFVEPRALFLTTSGDRVWLRPFVNGTETLSTDETTPTAWCIADTNIDLDCLCDQAHTFLFHYRRKWDLATETTNWLLSNEPDIYVAASMIALARYREGIDLNFWKGEYYEAKERAEKKAGRSNSIALLTADPALLPSGPIFNYTTGQ